jgi:hypothetical protein
MSVMHQSDVDHDDYMRPMPKPMALLDRLNLRPGRDRDEEYEAHWRRARLRVYHDND